MNIICQSTMLGKKRFRHSFLFYCMALLLPILIDLLASSNMVFWLAVIWSFNKSGILKCKKNKKEILDFLRL